jgi:pyruvate carboxylase
MSGLTSQPSMGAVCMALEQTALGTGIRFEDIQALNLYWSQVRMLYSCFEANVRASDSSVFDHEMPGGQYTNLMVSVRSLDLHLEPNLIANSSKLPSLAWERSGLVCLTIRTLPQRWITESAVFLRNQTEVH